MESYENYMNSVLKSMTSILRQIVEEKGGSYEFKESIPIIGRYGDRASTKYLFVKDGKLHAHVYSGWGMENTNACLESRSGYLCESDLRNITRLVDSDWH